MATKTKSKAKTNNIDMKRYLVSRKNSGDSDLIIEVPADWKITFGYVNPAKSSDAYRNSEGHCLRIYEMPGSFIRAAIGNVTGFRDLDLALANKIDRESGRTTWESSSEGNFKKETEVKKLQAEFAIQEVEDF